MKRWICIVFAIFLILCTAAYADGFDLDSLSITELLDLQTELDHKIVELSPYEDCVLYSGKYVVGEDLEEGNYVFNCVKVESNYFNQCYLRFLVWDESTGEYKDRMDDWGANLYVDEQYSSRVHANEIIDVESGILIAHKR